MARHLPTDEIIDLYVNQKMKVSAIAKRYDCSMRTIRQRLIEKGVYVRVKQVKIDLTPQQRELLLEIFKITYIHFIRMVREYKFDVKKLYELVTTEDAPYVVREDFYKLINNEEVADLYWEDFCDWWFKKYDGNNEND